jgi:four helix bundle protein
LAGARPAASRLLWSWPARFEISLRIAEASGRWHEADKRRLFVVARGSLYETEHWVLRARARSLLIPATDEQLNELGKTINGLIKKPTPR